MATATRRSAARRTSLPTPEARRPRKWSSTVAPKSSIARCDARVYARRKRSSWPLESATVGLSHSGTELSPTAHSRSSAAWTEPSRRARSDTIGTCVSSAAGGGAGGAEAAALPRWSCARSRVLPEPDGPTTSSSCASSSAATLSASSANAGSSSRGAGSSSAGAAAAAAAAASAASAASSRRPRQRPFRRRRRRLRRRRASPRAGAFGAGATATACRPRPAPRRAPAPALDDDDASVGGGECFAADGECTCGATQVPHRLVPTFFSSWFFE